MLKYLSELGRANGQVLVKNPFLGSLRSGPLLLVPIRSPEMLLYFPSHKCWGQELWRFQGPFRWDDPAYVPRTSSLTEMHLVWLMAIITLKLGVMSQCATLTSSTQGTFFPSLHHAHSEVEANLNPWMFFFSLLRCVALFLWCLGREIPWPSHPNLTFEPQGDCFKLQGAFIMSVSDFAYLRDARPHFLCIFWAPKVHTLTQFFRCCMGLLSFISFFPSLDPLYMAR